MARRAALLTTEDVLEELDVCNDDFDADEPMMPGSDDEFSDLEDVEDNSDDHNDVSTPPNTPPLKNLTTETLPSWSATLTPVNVAPFTSHVDLKLAIPESPSDTFDLMFTPAFLDTIVEQTCMQRK